MELDKEGILTNKSLTEVYCFNSGNHFRLIAVAQRDAMIAAGWHKHEAVTDDDVKLTIRGEIATAWNNGAREETFGAFLDRATERVLTALHKADWRLLGGKDYTAVEERLAQIKKVVGLAQRALAEKR